MKYNISPALLTLLNWFEIGVKRGLKSRISLALHEDQDERKKEKK